jgi:hypothetical protein
LYNSPTLTIMHVPFYPIARLLASTLHPAPCVDLSALQSFIPTLGKAAQGQGALITVNHYSAPDFQGWWPPILISAVIPVEIHWVVTSGWTNSGWLTGLTHWLFPRGARLLGFTPMPAMPPDPAETEQRAMAVRRVLSYARSNHLPMVGIAPEGRDIPGSVLGTLPSGVGRFMHLISQYCPQVVPVGLWKEDGIVNLNFGCPYQLEVQAGLKADERDQQVGEIVMRHIAARLPERLRGGYK